MKNMYEILNLIASTAILFVAAKFPGDFVDKSKGQDIFELIEMVGEKLVNKNYDIIAKPFFDSLVDVRTLGGEIYEYQNE